MSTAVVPRRAYRLADGRWLGGVCAGIAAHLGLPRELVRVVFAVLAVTGFGVVLYAAYWIVLPLDMTPAPTGAADAPRNRRVGALVGVLAAVLVVLVAISGLGLPLPWWVTLPALLVAAGIAVVWRQSDDAQRARALAAGSAGARAMVRDSWRRSLVGVGLVTLGVVAVVVGRGDVVGVVRSLFAGLLVVGGVVLVLLPWLLSAWRTAGDERRARIRSEERAEVAAHVHDSVLQTLSLIQHAADDPREVARLARAEERALRGWLYEPTADAATSLSAALARAVAEVEVSYDVDVDLVVVGDAARDPQHEALLQATRAALVNAARHAGGAVSVYVEFRDGAAEAYVRDRGPGFDPDAIPADRLGWRESIVGRMARVGGTATARPGPGGGTEITLRLPEVSS